MCAERVSEMYLVEGFDVPLDGMNEQNTRKPYPTDLTDAEWQRIAPALPERTSPRGRHRVHAYREILNAIFSILRSGCAWRMRPHDVPLWESVYHSVRL